MGSCILFWIILIFTRRSHKEFFFEFENFIICQVMFAVGYSLTSNLVWVQGVFALPGVGRAGHPDGGGEAGRRGGKRGEQHGIAAVAELLQQRPLQEVEQAEDLAAALGRRLPARSGGCPPHQGGAPGKGTGGAGHPEGRGRQPGGGVTAGLSPSGRRAGSARARAP